MNDFISRQDAIDVLKERLQANGYSNVALFSELNRSIGYLMQLPSAEPNLQPTCNQLATDTISRQAAIDAIWSHATKILESSDYDVVIQDFYKMAHRHIAEVIKQLPSVQSEWNTSRRLFLC